MATLPSTSAEEEMEIVKEYRYPEDEEHLLDNMDGINNSLFRVSE